MEPATTAPFHFETDDLQMISNDERIAVSVHVMISLILDLCEMTSVTELWQQLHWLPTCQVQT